MRKNLLSILAGALAITAIFAMTPPPAAVVPPAFRDTPPVKPVPKVYTVTLSLEQWVQIVNNIEYAKRTLKTSELPSRQVTFVVDSLLQPIQGVLADQINPQIQTDSVNKKSK